MIDNAKYVQVQDEVTNAEFDHLKGVFAYDIVKLSLGRAMDRAADALPEIFKAPQIFNCAG
jgi:hypothetical protein